MSTAFGIRRLGGACSALAAALLSTALCAPAAQAAGWGWGLGLGSNGVTVSPQASINIFGGSNDRRGYYEQEAYVTSVERAVVIVPARPVYRDRYDDPYWEPEPPPPPPRPRHHPRAKHGHHHHAHDGPPPRERLRYNGRDYYR